MKLVIGLIVGAVIGALVGYFVWGRQVADLQARVTQLEAKLAAPPARSTTPATTAAGNPHVAVIVIEGAAGEDCKAKVNPFKIGNKRNLKVYWAVDADDAQCDNGNGNWRIELRFDPTAGGTSWNNGTVDVRRSGVTPWRIPNGANYGSFPYHVWMVGTRTYEMADPELEIEQ